MTLGGWMFMIASWGVIISLFAFSIVRTLRTKDKDIELPPEKQV